MLKDLLLVVKIKKIIPVALLPLLISVTNLFGGDPILPGGNHWDLGIIGCTIEWINPYNPKGYSVGDRVKVVSIDTTSPWFANLEDGNTIHSDWIRINYIIRFTAQGVITDKTYSETLYFGHLFTTQFPSSGDKPQFGIIHSVTPTVHWDTSQLDQGDEITGGSVHFTLPDPTFIQHNIPDYPFKIGFDTYRLLEFKKFNTLQGTSSRGEYLIPQLSIKNFHITGNPGTGVWEMNYFTGEFNSPLFIRKIVLRYRATFSVLYWDGNTGNFSLYMDQEVAFESRYE